MLFSFKSDKQQFDEAAALHRAGKLPEAEALYRQILAVNPNNADALHMLGLLAHQGKRSDVAVDFIQHALRIAPNNATACSNLAEIQRSLGRVDAAIELGRRAIQLDPNLSAAHVNLAMALRQSGRLAESLAPSLRGAELGPTDSTARAIAGAILLDMGRPAEAIVHLEESARQAQWDANTLSGLAVCFERLERMDRALTLHQRAASLAPNNTRVIMNFGSLLARLDQYADAAKCFKKVLELQPNDTDAMEHLAGVQQSMGMNDESIQWCQRAITLKPDSVGAYATMGEALMGLGRFDETITIMAKIAETQPVGVVYHSWSNALVRSGNPAEGVRILDKAIALDPQNPVLHFNKSVILLMLGRYLDAWPEYEWRWKHPRVVGRVYKYPTPRWDGSPLNGQRILLYAEQGLGDTIFFGRYAALVAQRGGKVIMRVQPSLKELAHSIPGVSQVCAENEPVPDHDVHVPTMSLPGVFGTTLENIPVSIPYINTNPERSARWREELAKCTSKFKVGLVWEGGAFQVENYLRSASLAEYGPLGAVEDVAFFGLQKGTAEAQAKNPPPGMDFTDLGPFLKDFSETAAILEHLDLLISIDTSVIHIAAALGKPVWMLMAFTPGHMWMQHRPDTPWYPTVRIFRQPAFRDWASVITRVKSELEGVMAARQRGQPVTLP